MNAVGLVSSHDIRDVWTEEIQELSSVMQRGAGFSFNYNGQCIGPLLPADWKRSAVNSRRGAASELVFSHDTGLAVTRELRVFQEYGAVEYKLRFKNVGKKLLPPISTVCALDIALSDPAFADACIVSSGGGLADSFLPPRSFAIRRSCLAPTVPDPGIVLMKTEGGRSSNEDLPFFFIQNDTRQQGLFIAFGWSGQWEAFANRDFSTSALRVKAKIPDLEIILAPGEEIEGPTILLGLYKGLLQDGSNRLRSLIRHEYTPRLAGKKMLPIATYDHWFNIEEEFDESLLKKLADAAALIGQEYFLLDAAWYAGATKKDGFSAGLGNWQQVDRSKLPNGLEAVAEYVRSKGLKFGLWFEPERVASDSDLARTHPDWILWNQGKDPKWLSLFRERCPDHAYFKKNYGVLDFGRPEVQEWVCGMMDRYIRDHEVKYIRYDFNMDPLPYWEAHDAAGRHGIAQLRHMHGFYSVIDWLRERHPETVLEGCASGGRRIDLETARRFHTFWISDHTSDPAIIRFHLFGINYFLPGNYHYIQYTLPSPRQTKFQPDDIGFQSMFGGAFGMGGRIDLWSEEMKQKARLHVRTWKRIRRYLMEDYYPLSAQPGDMQSWSGWQFQDPQDHSGFVQTFRTNTADGTHRFMIEQLQEGARYRFRDAYTEAFSELTGSEAMTRGFEVSQDPMSSRIFLYERISSERR